MATERPFLLDHTLQVSKWSLRNLILYTEVIFNDFIYVYSPEPRAENPLGTNFWSQEKAIVTSTIYCKFQTNLFEFWFYTHFLMFFPHAHSPRAGADNPLWTKSWAESFRNGRVFSIYFMLCFLFADSISKPSYEFLRKSSYAQYSMVYFQQNLPLAFGHTMLWKWLKRSCLQCIFWSGFLITATDQ